jgi:hypothetical protein
MAKRTLTWEGTGLGGKRRFLGMLGGILRDLAKQNKIGARWREIHFLKNCDSYMAFLGDFEHRV